MVKFGENSANFGKIWANLRNFGKKTEKNSAIFNENFEIRERCKVVHCVDLGESFPTSIYLQNLASIQPRVLVKLPVAILTHQQFRFKYYYSQSSFRTPPVPSVFEDNPVYRRRRRE